MADTQYKRKQLADCTAPETPPGWNVRGGSVLEKSKTAAVQKAQDHALGGFRNVLTYHTGGLTAGWLVPSTAPAGGSHPDKTTWRTMQRSIVVVSPGADLECRLIALPSGGEDTDDGYEGHARFGANYDNGANSDSVSYKEVSIAVSPESNGAVGTSDSWDWFNMHHHYVGNYRPGTPTLTPLSERNKWSEFSTATLQFDVRGGARVLSANVSELPGNHVHSHDSDTATIHAYRETSQPTLHPQESAGDGATYEERRYGTHRTLDVSDRQAHRLGPVVFSWSSHTEQDTEVTDSECDPVSSTGTSYRSIFDSSVSAWSADEPGFVVPGAYAMRDREAATLPNAGAIPVIIRLLHQTTVGGTARVQVTERSWVEIDLGVTTGYDWSQTFAWLECDPAPDVNRTNGQVLIKHDSGGSVDLRAVVVEYAPVA